MATMTVTNALSTGADLTYNSIIAGGDILPNDGKTIVLFHNTGSATTITVTSQKQISGLDIEDPVAVVSSGTDLAMGPFDPTIFNTAAGAVEFSYSGGTATTTYRAISI